MTDRKEAPGASILHHFAPLKDPRVERTRRHSMTSILVISLCGMICGVDDWVEMEQFGKAKRQWFETFLDLPNGIPSHDTFGRFFAALDPEAFSRCFMKWVQAISEVTQGEVVAIDGKTLRRSFDHASSKAAIHMVSAWSAKNSLVLGQIKTDEKSNEITAIPKLLETLHLQGCIVTIDAMGCQKKIVADIIDKGAGYVISLKGNQDTLHEEVKAVFSDARAECFETVKHSYLETLEKDHGRIEKRRFWLTSKLDDVREKDKWPGLTSIGMIESQRTIGEATSTEVRYFISSLPGDQIEQFARASRAHWSVENNLHWVLDVAFAEDASRVRKDNAPENMAMLRHVALNLVKADKLLNVGIKARRKVAGWDHNYLAHLLGIPGAYNPPPTRPQRKGTARG